MRLGMPGPPGCPAAVSPAEQEGEGRDADADLIGVCPAGADVGDERLPALAQMLAGSPEHLPQRRLPLGGGARGSAGRLAVDLALQPQERCGIPGVTSASPYRMRS